MSFRSIISFALILVFAAACNVKPIEEAAVITEAPTFTAAPSNQPRPAEQCLLTDNGTGMPVISPSTVRSASCVGLQAGMVTVSWPEAPTNATMVEFWRMNANGMTDVIGTDSNLADGASIQWEVHETMPPSVIYAIPYVTGGANWSGQISVYIGQ